MEWDLSKASVGGKPITESSTQWDLSKASVSNQKSNEYKKLYQKIGLDSLENDLKSAAQAIGNAYGGWQDANTMKKTKKRCYKWNIKKFWNKQN